MQLLPLVKRTNKSRVLLDLGTAFFSIGDYKKALGYFQQTLDNALITTPDKSELIGDCYYYLASCNYELGNLDEALKAFKESLTLTDAVNFPISFALTLSAIAGIYSERSDYDNAILYEKTSPTNFYDRRNT